MSLSFKHYNCPKTLDTLQIKTEPWLSLIRPPLLFVQNVVLICLRHFSHLVTEKSKVQSESHSQVSWNQGCRETLILSVHPPFLCLKCHWCAINLVCYESPRWVVSFVGGMLSIHLKELRLQFTLTWRVGESLALIWYLPWSQTLRDPERLWSSPIPHMPADSDLPHTLSLYNCHKSSVMRLCVCTLNFQRYLAVDKSPFERKPMSYVWIVLNRPVCCLRLTSSLCRHSLFILLIDGNIFSHWQKSLTLNFRAVPPVIGQTLHYIVANRTRGKAL